MTNKKNQPVSKEYQEKLKEIVARSRSESAPYQFQQLWALMESYATQRMEESLPERIGHIEYPKYCACDGECLGECLRSRQNGFNEALDQIRTNFKKI